jgi:transposase
VAMVVSAARKRRAFAMHITDGLTPLQIQERMTAAGRPIGRTTVAALIEHWDAHGDILYVAPRKKRRYTIAHSLWIARYWKDHPWLYRDEMAKEFKKEFGFATTGSQMSQLARQRGLTYKKLTKLARQRCELVRAQVRATIAEVDPRAVIVLDEVHIANRDRRRTRGWAPLGEPAFLAEFFCGDTISASCIACMSMRGFVLPACHLTTESVDSDAFVAYATKYLLPELNEFKYEDGKFNENSFLVLDVRDRLHSGASFDLSFMYEQR